MRTLIAFALVSAVVLPVHAVEYVAVQADKSALTFVSKQMGVPVNGRFPKFTAQIAFDPAKPEAGKVSLSIDLAAIDAKTGAGNDAFVFIGTAGFSNAAGELRFFANGTSTIIQADVDGNGTADFEIALATLVTLVAADFIL